MAEFKFQLQGHVMTKTSIAESMLHASLGRFIVPRRFMVTERVSQECPGGVQLKYIISQDGARGECLECELANPSEFSIDEFLAALVRASERPELKARQDFQPKKEA